VVEAPGGGWWPSGSGHQSQHHPIKGLWALVFAGAESAMVNRS
jgi:hypothetical protein